jgi:hypothetical protein
VVEDNDSEPVPAGCLVQLQEPAADAGCNSQGRVVQGQQSAGASIGRVFEYLSAETWLSSSVMLAV